MLFGAERKKPDGGDTEANTPDEDRPHDGDGMGENASGGSGGDLDQEGEAAAAGLAENGENGEGGGSKNKKFKRNVPKVKKRPPNVSPESEVAYFEISRNYYDEDEAPDFKALMQDLEDSVAEALQ